MRRLLALRLCVLLATGCGHAPAPRSAPSDAPATSAARPLPWRAVEQTRQEFALPDGCQNGPYTIALELPPVRWITRVRVYTTGDRGLPLHFESNTGSFTTWIYDRDADPQCRAHGEAPAVAVVGEAPAAAPPPARSRGRKPAPAPAPAPIPRPVMLASVPPGPEGHPILQGEVHFTAGAQRREVPNLAGSCWTLVPSPAQISVKLWMPTAQRLAGARVRVVVEEIVPRDGGPEAIAAVEQAFARAAEEDRAEARRRIAECTANPQSPTCWIGCERVDARTGMTGKRSPGPPPAPPVETRPPRPHGALEWIAGSWRWTGDAYAWDPGFWRLPDPPAPTPAPGPTTTVAVASRGPATAPQPAPAPVVVAPPPPVVVPVAPPPPPIEAPPPPAPAQAVVWVPGYWSWNGAAWIWIAGGWQQPPTPAARFIPPTIVAAPGGVRVAPSRWIAPPPMSAGGVRVSPPPGRR